MSTLHQKLLPPQALVLRVLFHKLCKGGVYARFHLCRRKVCKGDRKNSVRVNGVVSSCEHAYNAFHQNGGFSASCRRRNKKVAAEGSNCRKLFGVPVTVWHAHHLLPPVYRIHRA